MPFCRKCGRRLEEYSLSCTDCGTSTTATLIKIKKASAKKAKADGPDWAALATSPVSLKVFSFAKPVKTVLQAKTAISYPSKKFELKKPAKTQFLAQQEPYFHSKPLNPAAIIPPHEIIKNNLSTEEDILTNPQDYQTQPFNFNLNCPHGHFWQAGKPLPVSNEKAYCPTCGEQLKKLKNKKQPRYHKY
jgi:hypothetical protein